MTKLKPNYSVKLRGYLEDTYMKFLPTLSLLLLIATCTSPLWAVDYKVDTTFNSQFGQNDNISDVFVQPDGKLLAGGALCPSFTGNCTPLIKRYNPDGTVDQSFSTPIVPITQGYGYVQGIRPLPNGQFMVTGDFNVGATHTNYVRLNADGSLDPTMTLTYFDSSLGATIIERMPDGKFVVCTERTINSQLYKIAHRINSDGSVDPTFRITFMDGFCTALKGLSNGKMMITVGTNTGQPAIKPLYRLNTDGTRDLTFDADLPVGSYAWDLTQTPSGKFLVTSALQGQNNPPVKRLMPDGALDINIPLCSGGSFLPLVDGTLIMSGCRRWANYFGNPLSFARVSPDGAVDPTLDAIYFEGYSDIAGFREAGNNSYYVFGSFRAIQRDYTRSKLQRLVPNLTPLKAKFDFDNDGRSDLAVFRPSDGYWYIKQSSSGYAYQQWGFPTDKPAASHFDNDGKTDVAIYRDGIWHAWSSTLGHRSMNIGVAGDKPMVGNFDDEEGEDIEDFAVRGLRNGVPTWLVRGGWTIFYPPYSSSTITIPGELPADKPIVGDFNGDGRDDFGYFRDGLWQTVDRRNYQPPASFQWGSAGDIPVPGDYDGDRQTDYAIFRPSTGEWWINRSSQGIIALRFGQNGDIPVPADYDGDGKVDIAIYRNGVWWQYRIGSGTVYVEQWGSPSDIPIPAQSQ